MFCQRFAFFNMFSIQEIGIYLCPTRLSKNWIYSVSSPPENHAKPFFSFQNAVGWRFDQKGSLERSESMDLADIVYQSKQSPLGIHCFWTQILANTGSTMLKRLA